MTSTSIATTTGFAAFAALCVNDARFTFFAVAIILATCITVLGHILLSCWRANHKAKRHHRKTGGRDGTVAAKNRT